MELRPYQKEAIKSLFDYWREKPRGIPLIVCPTGAGKTPILSEICRRVFKARPHYRIWIVTHRKELIEQNAKELYNFIKMPIGVYSASLGMKKIRSITCAGIQSIYKKPVQADLVIVDEAHLISANDGSMYQKFLQNILKDNSNVKFLGLTATPYRMDQGSLIGEFFNDVCYDVDLRDLITQNYLCNIISMPSKGEVNLDGVTRSGFDYNQGEVAERMSPLVPEHCKEILKSGNGRKSILVFASGVKHAKDLSEYLKGLGERAEHVHGEMMAMERDQIVNRFKSGETRILCNVDILTTGFNHPSLDCIALLRATRSTSLYVQMVGRGMRLAPGKDNCLVLDFGGNIERHGPLDCIRVKNKKEKGKVEIEVAPTKTCPECGAVWSIRVLECTCGYLFSRASTFEVKASQAPILAAVETLPVDSMTKRIYNKAGKPPMLRLDFFAGMRRFSEFFCFEHGGQASYFANQKWKKMGGGFVKTSQEAFDQEIKTPAEIKVIKDKTGYYRILQMIGQKAEIAPQLDFNEWDY